MVCSVFNYSYLLLNALNIKLITHFYDIALKADADNIPFLIKPPFLLITGAAVAYYAYKYGIIFSY